MRALASVGGSKNGIGIRQELKVLQKESVSKDVDNVCAFRRSARLEHMPLDHLHKLLSLAAEYAPASLQKQLTLPQLKALLYAYESDADRSGGAQDKERLASALVTAIKAKADGPIAAKYKNDGRPQGRSKVPAAAPAAGAGGGARGGSRRRRPRRRRRRRPRPRREERGERERETAPAERGSLARRT